MNFGNKPMAKQHYILIGAVAKNEPPQVVYIGRKGDAVAAANSAPAHLTDFQLGTFGFVRKVKRGEGGAPVAPAEDLPQDVEMLEALNQATARIRQLEELLEEAQKQNSTPPQSAPDKPTEPETTPAPSGDVPAHAPSANTSDDEGPRLPRRNAGKQQ